MAFDSPYIPTSHAPTSSGTGPTTPYLRTDEALYLRQSIPQGRDPRAGPYHSLTPEYAQGRSNLAAYHGSQIASSPGLTSNSYPPGTYDASGQARALHWDSEDRLSRYGDKFPRASPAISPPVYQNPSMSRSIEYSSGSEYSANYGNRPGLLRRRSSSEGHTPRPSSRDYHGSDVPLSSSGSSSQRQSYPQRRPSNRDEFDGPSQLLDKPVEAYEPREEELPQLPVTLQAQEQDSILTKVNDRLSLCAFNFVAHYQFPIPIEPDKRPVRVPADREWSEWVFLLKRLATKRRIPTRVLYNGQIKQLITILENSLEMRHAAKHQSRPLKDDRNILQLISSGIQVAKILKDAPSMQYLDRLYSQTERLIRSRRDSPPVQNYRTG